METKIVHVYTIDGSVKAEMIRQYLEAQGIWAMASQEAAGTTYGLTIGILGEARIYVREEQEKEARSLLRELDSGKLGSVSADATLDDPEDK